MSQLPQSQNSHRWEPPAKVVLRAGQKRLYEIIRDSNKEKYAIRLPTGYGKSWCACIAYATLRSQGRVDRMLIIVPTDQQRSQYIAGLYEDLDTLEIPVLGIERCENSQPWVIKTSWENKSEIFVVGVQSILAASDSVKKEMGAASKESSDCLDYYHKLLSKNNWLVVADEYHHYGEDGHWGKSVKSLSYKVILGMSATPFRRDGKNTILGSGDFDVDITLRDAMERAAIRPIRVSISNYSLTWQSIGEDPQTGTMSDLEKESLGDISEYERKKGTRYLTKYISTIFTEVLDAWFEYERIAPDQNQILVFAMTCRHAQSISETINTLTQDVLDQPFSDWIGVSTTEGSGRSEQENQSVLDRFKDNKLKCLVQVNKAGEGFNNKRCSIGLMLDLVGDTPMKRQHIGRFMRINKDGGGLPSVIFVSEDSPCRPLLEDMLKELGASAESKEGVGGQKDRQLVIPDIFVLDAKWESTRVVWPMGTLEASADACIESSPNLSAAIASKTILKEEVMQWMVDQQKSKFDKDNPPLTSKQRREQLTEQVKRNVSKLVNDVVRKRFGSTAIKSSYTDYYRTVHSQWKRVHGAGHSEMTEEDLKAKNVWLQDVADKINTTGIPTWLM